MALNVDVDSVTVRNLAIRHMPQHGITVWYQDSNNWTIENNEIDHNKFGLEFSANTTLRNNYIHHNVSQYAEFLKSSRARWRLHLPALRQLADREQ